MVKITVRAWVGLLCFAFCGPAWGQPEAWKRMVDETFAVLDENVRSLSGKMSQDERIWRIVAEHLARNPQALSKIEGLANNARESGKADQKEFFLTAIVQLVCQSAEDNCALRREIQELRARLHALEQQQGGPQIPQPEPTPAPEYQPGPEWGPPEQPRRRWVGPINFITDNRVTFCPRARRLAGSVYCYFADGDIYYGDVYLTCRGNYVLLRLDERYYQSVARLR
jgi:hypothetical protein